MKDKYIAGAIAGIIGALIQDVYAYLVKLLGFSDRGFIDFARAVIFSTVNDGTMEMIVASIAHIIWDLLLGILFVYIIERMSKSFYYCKALIYGSFLWFMIQVLGTLFRLPMFFHIPARAALLTLTGAICYSLGIALFVRVLGKRNQLQ